MGQKKGFMEDKLGAVISNMSGYTASQIRDIKNNKIALNAYGEPVYTATGKAAKPNTKIDVLDPIVMPLFTSAIKDYGTNTVVRAPLGKKEQWVNQINADMEGIKLGGEASNKVLRRIAPTSGAGAAGRLGYQSLMNLFK